MLLQAASGEGVVTGQILYTTPGDGSFNFIVPAGVTSISVVCVSPGGIGSGDVGASGGSLAYANNVTVTPGQSFTAQFQYAYQSRLINNSTSLPVVYAWQNPNSDRVGGQNLSGYGYGGAGRGQTGYDYDSGGGGGAGGYTGNGGIGGNYLNNATSGAGGGGGGGARGSYRVIWGEFIVTGSGAGGGVGVLGQGANGAGAVYGYDILGGGGGSGGANGEGPSYWRYYDCCGNPFGGGSTGGTGGAYGGGGGSYGGFFGQGAIRIIWPGNTRTFPNTNTGNL